MMTTAKLARPCGFWKVQTIWKCFSTHCNPEQSVLYYIFFRKKIGLWLFKIGGGETSGGRNIRGAKPPMGEKSVNREWPLTGPSVNCDSPAHLQAGRSTCALPNHRSFKFSWERSGEDLTPHWILWMWQNIKIVVCCDWLLSLILTKRCWTILQSFCHPVNRRNNTWLNSIWQIYEELLVVELIGQGLIFHINLLSAGMARLGGDLETNELPNLYYLCLEISF